MKNLQRYNLGELARHYASDKDNVVCRAYDVDKLEASHAELEAKCAELEAKCAELLEALSSLTAVVGLTPIKGNLEAVQEAYDQARAAIAKAKGEQP